MADCINREFYEKLETAHPRVGGESKSKDEIFADRDELRQRINESPEIFFSRDGSGQGYICPVCNSGSGKNGTGLKENPKRRGHYTCFGKCNKPNSKDVIGWIMESRGIDFNAALEYGAEVLHNQELLDKNGKPSSSYRKPEKKTPPPVIKPVEEKEIDYTPFFEDCFQRINDTNYHRGLSDETLRKFYIGFCPRWKHPNINPKIRGLEAAIKVESDEEAKKEMIEKVERLKKIQYTPRLIIPTSDFSYLARATNENQKSFKKPKVGKVHLFNEKSLRAGGIFFVVEGEIDAMSIVEVGGQAVGLGSMSFGSLLIEAIKKIEIKPAAVIISMDNEEKTKKPALELESALKNLGIETIVKNEIFSPYKDANAYLMADRQGFKAVIEREINSAAVLSNLTERSNSIQEKKSESSTSRLEGEISEGKSMNDKLVDRDVQEGVAGKYDDVEGKLFQPISDFLSSGEFQDSIEERKQYKELKIGFSNMTQPLYIGIILLGAIPGLGKTTLSLQAAVQIARQDQLVVFITFEQPKDFLTAKILARETYLLSREGIGEAITATQIIKGGSGGALTTAIEKYKRDGKNLIVYEASAKDNIDVIIEMMEKTFLSKGMKPVIFIDYLQRIPSKEGRGRQSTKEVIDESVFKLNQFQRKYKLILWIISSFNRDNYLRQVDFESFKESGGIEYTADLVYGMQLEVMNQVAEMDRKEIDQKRKMTREAKRENPRKIELVCLKNRYGAIGESYHFFYYPAFDFFEPFEPEKIDRQAREEAEESGRSSSKFVKRNRKKPVNDNLEQQPPHTSIYSSSTGQATLKGEDGGSTITGSDGRLRIVRSNNQPVPPPPDDDDYDFEDDDMFDDE